MELGNVVFGNSRGEAPVPRCDPWESYLCTVLDAACGTERGDDFDNDVFTVFPYWWGDCTCGYDFFDDGHKRLRAVKHQPECYHIEYLNDPRSKDFRGDHDWLRPLYRKRGWKTDGKDWWAGCAVRCDCDYDERVRAIELEYAEEFGNDGHLDTCNLVRPNFLYKPTGWSLQWYKYPLRDAYMTPGVSEEEYKKIMLHCLASVSLADLLPGGES